jgi:hypothetical protein
MSSKVAISQRSQAQKPCALPPECILSVFNLTNYIERLARQHLAAAAYSLSEVQGNLNFFSANETSSRA